MPEPRVVAEVGGIVVAEHGPLVLLVDRGTGPLATLVFVVGVLAVVFGGFGAVTLVLAGTIPWWVGAIFLGVGLAFACAVVLLRNVIRHNRTRPVSGYRPVAVFDRARRVYLDADGAAVAPLDQVRIQTRTRLTSSAPALVATTAGGSRILARGNPFNGGLSDLPAVLERLLHDTPH